MDLPVLLINTFLILAVIIATFFHLDTLLENSLSISFGFVLVSDSTLLSKYCLDFCGQKAMFCGLNLRHPSTFMLFTPLSCCMRSAKSSSSNPRSVDLKVIRELRSCLSRYGRMKAYIRAFSLFLLAFAASEVFGADTEGDAGSVCGLVSFSVLVPIGFGVQPLKIIMENPNHLNEPNEAIPEMNPVVPEPNKVADIHDPNEMVDIPDDIDLVDYDDEDPEEVR
ncbi:hypothetical protein Tco_1030102 [Tanacetum coccineum]|uniref:Transmembrane protein n=1 Tax=Tanacetum coccineum TaxID=301880 RepID=A0ABQ5G5B3_9ASTR